MTTRKVALISLPIYALPLPVLMYFVCRAWNTPGEATWQVLFVFNILDPQRRLMELYSSVPAIAAISLAIGLGFWGLHLGLRALTLRRMHRASVVA